MNAGICSRYTDRPGACVLFPRQKHEIEEFTECGFWFTPSGIRKGSCNGCGACCIKAYLYLPEYGRKFRDEPCPYFVET